MNRRRFLKVIGIGAVAVVVPVIKFVNSWCKVEDSTEGELQEPFVLSRSMPTVRLQYDENRQKWIETERRTVK